MKSFVGFCCILIINLIALIVCDVEQLYLAVPHHQPCRNMKPGQEAIRFADSKSAQIVEDPSRGPGCYKLAGKVKILKPVKGKLNMYVESKNGTHAEPVECKNRGDDGCGGIGSCVYCDACNTITKDQRNKIQLLSDGRNLDCGNLQIGEHPKVELAFCTPSLDDFLKSQNIARSAWDDVIGPQGTAIFETVYIFQETPIQTYSREKVNEAIKAQDGLIGCHKLVLNLSSVKKSNN